MVKVSIMKKFKKYTILVVISLSIMITSQLMGATVQELTPKQKIIKIKALTTTALIKAKKTIKINNLPLMREAQELINQASALDCDVSKHSAGQQNAKLAQAALDASYKITKILDLLLATTNNIIASSTDDIKVAAAKAFQLKVTNTKEDILTCQKIAVKAGANMDTIEAYEPTTPHFIHIPDITPNEPASPI